MTANETGIYDHCGTPVTITGYCGKHRPKWSAANLTLLRVTYHDTGRTGHVHGVNLRGKPEAIDAAVDAAPVVELTAAELKAALAEAE
jgi:hypothetical protein